MVPFPNSPLSENLRKLLEESLQVGVSFSEVILKLKNPSEFVSQEQIDEDSITTLSVLQTCLNRGSLVLLLQQISTIPKLSVVDEVKKKKKKPKKNEESETLGKGKKIKKKSVVRDIKEPEFDSLDESPENSFHKSNGLLKNAMKEGAPMDMSMSLRVEPSYMNVGNVKEDKKIEQVVGPSSLMSTSMMEQKFEEIPVNEPKKKKDFGSYRDFKDDSMSKSFAEPQSLTRSSSVIGAPERKKEFEERKRALDVRKKEIEEKKKNALRESPHKEMSGSFVPRPSDFEFSKVDVKKNASRELFSETKDVEVEKAPDVEKPNEYVKQQVKPIKLELPDEPFVPLKPASPKMVQFNPVVTPLEEPEHNSPRVSFSTVVTVIDKNPEVKDDEVDKLLNEATPIRRKDRKEFDSYVPSVRCVQKDAFSVATRLVDSMLHNKQFVANVDIELEMLQTRLENIKTRSYFLKKPKTDFQSLEIENPRGYESTHDNLVKMAITSEKLKYREERLKIAESLFQLEFKHESESTRLYSAINKVVPRERVAEKIVEETRKPSPSIEDNRLTPKVDKTEKDQNGTVHLRFDTPQRPIAIVERTPDKLRLNVPSGHNYRPDQAPIEVDVEDFDVVSSEPVSDNEKTPRRQMTPSRSKQEDNETTGRHMKLYIDMPIILPKAKQLEIQENKCSGCGVLIKEGFFTRLRYCTYSNCYYCNDCHKNEMAVIPAFVIQNWDFRPNYVCTAAKSYLDSIQTIPMVCVSAINPGLFDKVPNLMKARMLRKRLMMQWDILSDCEAKPDLVHKLKLDHYLNYLSNTEIYSLQNLEHLNQDPQKSPFLKKLSKIFAVLSEHICNTCKYCKKKAGQICSVCYDTTPIFAFNLSTVNTCPSCGLIYHKGCFKNRRGTIGCPNC